jgi:voltage-gated sodium channel
MFTVEGWNEIPAAIVAHINENGENLSPTRASLLIGLTRFYFVTVVLLGGVFGMSLANAVFVDEMTMDNNDALESKIDQLQNDIQELKTLLQQKKDQ